MSASVPPSLQDVLEVVRAFVAHHLPGETASEVRIRLASGRRVEHPVQPGAAPARPAPAARRHSPDFRTVSWDGADYTLSPALAAAVKVLWEAGEDGSPDVGQDTILEAAGSEGSRVRDLFRSGDKVHPAWNTLVVSSGRGLFRLAW